MAVDAEQLAVSLERQHVGEGIDPRLVKLVETDQLVADLVGRIAEHEDDLLRALCDAAEADGEAVARKDWENDADRFSAELGADVVRYVAYRGVVALRSRHHRFGHCDDVSVADGEALGLGRLENAFGDYRAEIVSLADDGAADAARYGTDSACVFVHKKIQTFLTGFPDFYYCHIFAGGLTVPPA